jgi:hypothetical protein
MACRCTNTNLYVVARKVWECIVLHRLCLVYTQAHSLSLPLSLSLSLYIVLLSALIIAAGSGICVFVCMQAIDPSRSQNVTEKEKKKRIFLSSLSTNALPFGSGHVLIGAQSSRMNQSIRSYAREKEEENSLEYFIVCCCNWRTRVCTCMCLCMCTNRHWQE